MADASTRGWGDPGVPNTASAVLYRKQHIVTIDVGGIRLHVRREVAPLFAGFIHEITNRGYDLTARADDWAYICRPVRGFESEYRATHDPKYLSNHSWGLAVDLNAVTNPMTSDWIVHTDMPDWVIDVAHAWGLSWGGDYSGRRKDPMHFEYVGTLVEAERLVESLTLHPAQDPEVDVFEPKIVTIPPPRADGAQVVGADIHGELLAKFHHDVTATIKANDNGTPVEASVQVCEYAGMLVLSFVSHERELVRNALDGSYSMGKRLPVAQGNVEVIIGHPAR